MIMHSGSRAKTPPKGQAIVEYILVLFVIIVIALFFLQFSTAFRAWSQSYVGDYVACLLETGELPALGNTEGNEGICNSQFEPFTIAAGRAPGVPQPQPYRPGGGGAGGAGAGDADGAGASDADGAGDTGAGAGGRNRGRNRFVTNSAVGVRNGAVGGGGRNNRIDLQSAEDNKNARGAGANDFDSYSGAGNRGRVRRSEYRGLAGVIYEEDEPTREKEFQSSFATAPAAGNRENTRPKKFAFVVDDSNKEVDLDEDDEGFSLGNLLRILLFAAIAIALMVFLGGQVAQVAKGWDGGK